LSKVFDPILLRLIKFNKFKLSLVDNIKFNGDEEEFLFFLKFFQKILDSKFKSSELLYLIELPIIDE
jgi:hypothetical protein